ncbi:hypothetical protein QL285_021920 [Trifolium repens]|jgi:hypothetical protein|nr:hypothetical protein QL285_021920 [Trifolium repens]
MVELLGSCPADDAEEVHITKGAHARTTYMQAHFKTLLERAEGDEAEVGTHQKYVARAYLMLVVDYTIFAHTSKNCVHLFYLNYFRDLEMVSDYTWGPAALMHLYKGLSANTTTRAITC